MPSEEAIVCCRICKRETSSVVGQKRHYGIVHGKNTKACEACGEDFPIEPSKEDQISLCIGCTSEYGSIRNVPSSERSIASP